MLPDFGARTIKENVCYSQRRHWSKTRHLMRPLVYLKSNFLKIDYLSVLLCKSKCSCHPTFNICFCSCPYPLHVHANSRPLKGAATICTRYNNIIIIIIILLLLPGRFVSSAINLVALFIKELCTICCSL